MLDKLIEKRLDQYYSNKLMYEIVTRLKFIWDLDFKTKREENRLVMYVKKRKYKDSEYKPLIHFRYDEAIIHLFRITETMKYINKVVEDYSREE